MMGPRVGMETERGEIIIRLHMDKAPITAGHFLELAGEGFYDGKVFWRIARGYHVRDVRENYPPEYRDMFSDESVGRIAALYAVDILPHFVIQGGVPEGGPEDFEYGRPIRLETHDDVVHFQGAVGMARGKENDSATCQFYIVTNNIGTVVDQAKGSALPHLDGRYAVFGQVVSDFGVLYKIEKNDRILKATIL